MGTKKTKAPKLKGMKMPGKAQAPKRGPTPQTFDEIDRAAMFNVDNHAKSVTTPQARAPIPPFVDGSDALANRQQMVLSFQSEASGQMTFFKAFIMALNETYNSDWASEPVFGRVDPIKMFRTTERKITLAFKVPASSESEAYDNLGKIQSLIQCLYPTYIGMSGQSAQMLGQSPLVRLKVMNLVQANQAAKEGTQSKSFYESYATDLTPGNGLLGVINNLQVNHNLESAEATVIQKGINTILPTYIDISLDFSPIHEHAVGWSEEGEALTSTFPYGIQPGLSATDQKNLDAIGNHYGPDHDAATLNDCLSRATTDADKEKCMEQSRVVAKKNNKDGTLWDRIESPPDKEPPPEALMANDKANKAAAAAAAGIGTTAAAAADATGKTTTTGKLDQPIVDPSE